MIWKHLYSNPSSDYGTLAFFRSRLNRVAVTKDPKKSVDASVELLETITKGHWLSCACEILGISGLDDTLHLPASITTGTASEKYAYIRGLAQQIVDKATIVDSAYLPCDIPEEHISDAVYNYSRVLCHYGALVTEFRDALTEGDGERVMRCWRLFMPHFKTAGCTKYALEALRLHIQLKTLSPNLAHQVKWHRFVNTRGGLGRNIPCDLHNEQVNKVVKMIIQNMGPNLTEQALQRAVRCVSPLLEICKGFDTSSQVPIITSAHSTRSDAADIGKVVSIVLRQKLLTKLVMRKHHSFPKMKHNPLDRWNRETTKTWIREKIKEYGKYKGRFRDKDVSITELSEED